MNTNGNTNTNTNGNPNNPTGRSGLNRAVAAGLTLGVLGGTAAGLVFGVPGLTSAASSDVAAQPAAIVQQVDDTDPPVDAPADDMRAEAGTRLRESLQSLVDDGTITAEQADAVTARLVENRPERPERGGRGEGRGAGRGEGGGEGWGEGGGPGMFGRGVASEALTDLLGLDAQGLRQQLRDGATLAEIATTQGVEPQAVIDELVAELTERVDDAVEDGRIDQTEADQKLADAEAKITDMVNNGRPD